ncbi:hypothetical protein SLE2022_334340 [Rubroshorea leprosula]
MRENYNLQQRIESRQQAWTTSTVHHLKRRRLWFTHVKPPSTIRLAPLIYLASLLAKKSTALATSSAVNSTLSRLPYFATKARKPVHAYNLQQRIESRQQA